jgi:hypothetical protein
MSLLLIALLAWLVAALIVYLAEDAEGERNRLWRQPMSGPPCLP